MQVTKVDFNGKTYRAAQKVSIVREERFIVQKSAAVLNKNG